MYFIPSQSSALTVKRNEKPSNTASRLHPGGRIWVGLVVTVTEDSGRITMHLMSWNPSVTWGYKRKRKEKVLVQQGSLIFIVPPQGHLRLPSPPYLLIHRLGPELSQLNTFLPFPSLEQAQHYLPDRPLKFAPGQAPDPFAKLAHWVVISH